MGLHRLAAVLASLLTLTFPKNSSLAKIASFLKSKCTNRTRTGILMSELGASCFFRIRTVSTREWVSAILTKLRGCSESFLVATNTNLRSSAITLLRRAAGRSLKAQKVHLGWHHAVINT